MSVEKGPKGPEEVGAEKKEVPDWLQKKIQDLEKIEAQNVPDWVKKDKAKNVERLRQEIKHQQEWLEQMEAIKRERKEDVAERFGPEVLRYAEGIAENAGENIETHLLKAKNKEQAKEMLHLWQDFNQAVNILLNQDSDRGRTDEDALKRAIRDFRPSDGGEYRHLTEKPDIK